MAARVGYGTLRGLRTLWLCWFALGAAVVGWELWLRIPGPLVLALALAVPAVPAAVVVHELGHAWAAWALGYRGIRLERTRAGVVVSCPAGRPRDDAAVALAGPLLSLVAGLVLGAGALLGSPQLLVAPALIVGAGGLALTPFAHDGRAFWTWVWTELSHGRLDR